jgi:hypothetical protein
MAAVDESLPLITREESFLAPFPTRMLLCRIASSCITEKRATTAAYTSERDFRALPTCSSWLACWILLEFLFIQEKKKERTENIELGSNLRLLFVFFFFFFFFFRLYSAIPMQYSAGSGAGSAAMSEGRGRPS